ncbi:putative multicopper oxidase [Xylariaceae sp. FL0255]|nr:putative multicopper oxidase [Xylariaceae sp. FL0255]
MEPSVAGQGPAPIASSSEVPRLSSDHESIPPETANHTEDAEKDPFKPANAQSDQIMGGSGKRRIAWLSPVLFIFVFISVCILSGMVLSINPEGEHSEIQTSPEEEWPLRVVPAEEDDSPKETKPLTINDQYILNPNWEFSVLGGTKVYSFVITDGEASPDGVLRPMMLINNQFPGPLIEVNENDRLVVHVENRASNATALHWHGIFQNGSPWMDGAVGIAQCPIPPGQSYTYQFDVTLQSGTYFYHGHQGVQALDGLVGPMVVRSLRELATPYSSDRVILLQDWYYDQASGLMHEVLSPGNEDSPSPNTALMNGVNQAICSDHPGRDCTEVPSTSLTQLEVAQGEQHRLRFINAGGFAFFQVAVDEHADLKVIEVDGTIVDPVLSSPLVIAPGQRYSAILKADHEEGAFWLRAQMITACFKSKRLPENGIAEAKGIVNYTKKPNTRRGEGIDEGDEQSKGEELVLPETESEIPFVPICKDLSSDTVFHPNRANPVPEVADHSWYLRTNLAIGDWRLQRGVLNSSSFRPNVKSPSLFRLMDGLAENNETFAEGGISDAFDTTSEFTISVSTDKIETIDIILQNMDENSHPFHLHGGQMWVLGAGHGYWPGYEHFGLKPEGKGFLNPENQTALYKPLLRDTITVEAYGWTLLRFRASNPGVWAFHCHVIWHSEAGMGMQFVSGVNELRTWKIPDEARTLCDAPEEELRKGAPPKDEIFFGFHDDE